VWELGFKHAVSRFRDNTSPIVPLGQGGDHIATGDEVNDVAALNNSCINQVDPLGLSGCTADEMAKCKRVCGRFLDRFPRAIVTTDCSVRFEIPIPLPWCIKRYRYCDCYCICDCTLNHEEPDPRDPNRKICSYGCVGIGQFRGYVRRDEECPRSFSCDYVTRVAEPF
jgi:hypothetical protein